MPGGNASKETVLGFMTVVDGEHGVLGGYLLLNGTGRPLEFHCTMPLKPNRAQEILYGPTLKPYLYGDQIAPALVGKASSKVSVLLTDSPDVLAVRATLKIPVVVVAAADGDVAGPGAAGLRLWRVDAEHPGRTLKTFHIGNTAMAVAEEFAADATAATAALQPLGTFDFHEPFGRIREAIDEAGRA